MRTSNAHNDRHGSLGDVTFTRFSRALLLADMIQSPLLSLSLSLSHYYVHAPTLSTYHKELVTHLAPCIN